MPTKPKVFVSRKIPEAGLRLLEGEIDYKVWPKEEPPSQEELIENTRDCHGLVSLLTDKLDDEVFSHCPKLKIIAQYAVGYNNIDVQAATKRKIAVSNTPGVLTDTTADTAFALLMSVARRIPECDEYVKTGEWRVEWAPLMMLGTDVHHKTLGIIGMGRIGKAIAQRARGFEMNLIYSDTQRDEEVEKKFGARFATLEELLRESDFVSVHVPLVPETKHLINAEKLSLMKKTAFLINTSRGQVVDEQALAQALEKKQIAGAALDVFEIEPLPRESQLNKMKNVVLVPHIGSASKETREKMSEIACANIVDYFSGKKPRTCVNAEALG